MKNPPSTEKAKIFAYLRRSTKKQEQEESLEKQYDSIPMILEDMGLSMEDITKSFSDSFTGYKVKTIKGSPQLKRQGFKEMVETIRGQKVPCILLAFNPSRLTRNVPDGTTIKEFLGHHENKHKIEYIRFCDGTIWDKNTPATVIDAEVNKAVAYSERLAKDKVDNNLTSLRRGILPKTIKTPRGLKATNNGLEETEEMPFIYHAFEMKAKWETGKAIEKYLISKGIGRIKEGNLVKVFENTKYIGLYQHPKVDQPFLIKFRQGRPAIPKALWDKVQYRIGKKGSGYGELQEGDIIAKLIKIRDEEWKELGIMTGYNPIDKSTRSRKARQYKSGNIKKFNLAEMFFLKSFTDIIDRMCFVWLRAYLQSTIPETEKSLRRTLVAFPCYDEQGVPQLDQSDLRRMQDRIAWWKYILQLVKDCTSLKEFKGKAPKFPIEEFFNFANPQIISDKKGRLQEYKKILEPHRAIEQARARLEMGTEKASERWATSMEEELDNTVSTIQLSNQVIQEALRQTELAKGKKKEWVEQKKAIETLERDQAQIQKEILTIRSNALLIWITNKAELEALTQARQDEIGEIEGMIAEYDKLDEVERYIEKLPEVLAKTFELATSSVKVGTIRGAREDILKLMEISTFELTLNTKKELKVKLFDALEGILCVNGGWYRIRTYDPLLVRQML